jgi:hypothetical protein
MQLTGRSVGIVRSQTQATELVNVVNGKGPKLLLPP